jgi:hypothetical protein
MPPFTGPMRVFAGKTRNASSRRRILPERERNMNNNDEPQRAHKGRVFAGLLIIAAGAVLLADRIGISGIHLSGRYWPLLLMALGIMRLVDPPMRRNGRRSRWTGAWFIYLGLWGFVSEFHVLGLDYSTSWPLLIVGAGIGMIWRALEDPENRQCRQTRES